MLRNVTLLIADYIILFAIISILCGAQVVTLFIDSKSSSEYVSLKIYIFAWVAHLQNMRDPLVSTLN
jgi:hypothetical protein